MSSSKITLALQASCSRLKSSLLVSNRPNKRLRERSFLAYFQQREQKWSHKITSRDGRGLTDYSRCSTDEQSFDQAVKAKGSLVA